MRTMVSARCALVFVALSALLAFAGCNDESSLPFGGFGTCGAAGATQPCVCSGGGDGAQVCGAGGAWGACDCGAEGDAGVLPDGGAPDTDTSDTPDADTPDADTPDADTPDTDVPDADVDLPDVDVPDTTRPDADLPDADLSDADLPDADVPDTDLPDTGGSDTDTPDADLPDTDTPDTDLPDTNPPDSGTDVGTDTDVPDVSPGTTMTVELLWDTPGDADQTDTGFGVGADLDLHVRHENGCWRDGAWDCHWANLNPTWGGVATACSLVRDDTDGAGPELIEIYELSDGVTYTIGVEYYATNDFGPSLATLRVYDGSTPVGTYSTELTADGMFWVVATIDGTTGALTSVDSVSSSQPPCDDTPECTTALDCAVGERCEGGTCVPDPSGDECSSDRDCELLAAELGGDDGLTYLCATSGTCYTAGVCGAGLVDPFPIAGDPFAAECPAGSSCSPVLDLGGATFGNACGTCDLETNAPCRRGEVCTAPLLPFPGAGNYCGTL